MVGSNQCGETRYVPCSSQLSQCLVPLDRGKRLVPVLVIVCPASRDNLARRQAKLHLSYCADFRGGSGCHTSGSGGCVRDSREQRLSGSERVPGSV